MKKQFVMGNEKDKEHELVQCDIQGDYYNTGVGEVLDDNGSVVVVVVGYVQMENEGLVVVEYMQIEDVKSKQKKEEHEVKYMQGEDVSSTQESYEYVVELEVVDLKVMQKVQ